MSHHNHALIAELKQETANTRKILESVPEDKFGWKPHEKSMTLGRLATHIAELPGWIELILTTDGLDFATRNNKPHTAADRQELLAILEDKLAKATEALENATPEDMLATWTMRRGDHIHFTLPKSAVIRNFSYSHLFHHRGQLTVFLRLLDVPVFGIYGPSADDIAARAAQAAEATA